MVNTNALPDRFIIVSGNIGLNDDPFFWHISFLFVTLSLRMLHHLWVIIRMRFYDILFQLFGKKKSSTVWTGATWNCRNCWRIFRLSDCLHQFTDERNICDSFWNSHQNWTEFYVSTEMNLFWNLMTLELPTQSFYRYSEFKIQILNEFKLNVFTLQLNMNVWAVDECSSGCNFDEQLISYWWLIVLVFHVYHFVLTMFFSVFLIISEFVIPIDVFRTSRESSKPYPFCNVSWVTRNTRSKCVCKCFCWIISCNTNRKQL